MTYALVLLALAVVGVVGAVAAGAVSGGLPPAPRERPSTPLPGDRVGRLQARDVDAARFSTGLRGYRMDEVDAAMARLRTELEARDAELAELYGVAAPAAGGPHPEPATAPSTAPSTAAEAPVGAAPSTARPGSRRAAREA